MVTSHPWNHSGVMFVTDRDVHCHSPLEARGSGVEYVDVSAIICQRVRGGRGWIDMVQRQVKSSYREIVTLFSEA